MPITATLARGDTRHRGTIAGDLGRHVDPAGKVYSILNSEGYLVDPQRVLTHPGFDQVEGQGIYTYPYNPDDTLNFVLAPARQLETTIQRTLAGSILVQQVQDDTDIVVTEIWRGGGDKLSTVAEMFRAFYEFSLRTPAIGEALTWEPRDLSEDSYQVQIVSVQLGSGDLQYREIREDLSTRDGAYLTETLTLKLKLVGGYKPPQSVVTLAGI